MTEIRFPEEYLGDGVYASFDGYHIFLDLRAQGPDRIALEPPVLDKLLEYRERMVNLAEQYRQAGGHRQ